MRGSSPKGVPSKLTGKRKRSVTPQRDRAAPQKVRSLHPNEQSKIEPPADQPDLAHQRSNKPGEDMMTVAELIEHLKQFDPTAIVMANCIDDYYSGPLTVEDFSAGDAVNLEPFEQLGPKEDERGRPITPKLYKYDGGWVINGDHEGRPYSERKPCVIIRIE